MTQGEGFIGLLYALKDLFEAGVIWVITGFAVIAFFWLIVKFIANKYGFLQSSDGGPFGKKVGGGKIVYALFLLFVIFAIYSLIGLFAAIFGLNSGPAGGLILR